MILSVSNPHANLANEHETQPNNPQLTYSTSPSQEHTAAPHARSSPTIKIMSRLFNSNFTG